MESIDSASVALQRVEQKAQQYFALLNQIYKTYDSLEGDGSQPFLEVKKTHTELHEMINQLELLMPSLKNLIVQGPGADGTMETDALAEQMKQEKEAFQSDSARIVRNGTFSMQSWAAAIKEMNNPSNQREQHEW